MIQTVKDILRNYFFRFKFRKQLVMGKGVRIARGSFFEGMNKIHPRATFSGYMGYGSYIGWDCNLNARLKVGRFTCIAPYTQMNDGKHPYTTPFATVHPAFFSLRKQNGSTFATRQLYDESSFVDDKKDYTVEIGSDCWIGQGVLIVGGVEINDGAMVLARATVTKDVPPYAIVGGVPAKIIGYRYDEETIDFLLKNKWWEKDIEWLKNNWELLTDIEQLKQQLK